MNFNPTRCFARLVRGLACVVLIAVLAACSWLPNAWTSDKPKLPEFTPGPALIAVRLAWTTQIGEISFPLDIKVSGDNVVVAANDGTLAEIDARTGATLMRTALGLQIAAGVGSDGKLSAVVSRENELVAASSGRQLWKQRLPAQVFTAPLVAGGRVFVLAADRSVSAFDGASGKKLWTQLRPGEALVLRQAGVMLAVGDTLVVGLSGRLVGLNPGNGSVRWEAPIATPRGTNDVERLVDLVGHVDRAGNMVCARAFQSAVGCVNAQRGTVLWTRAANGAEGLHGDEAMVFGTESDGRVIAWQQASGERAWVNDRLLHRTLSAPVLIGRSIAVGDNTGLVHFLARDDGKLLASLPTDGSAITATPALAGGTLVVVTRKGGVFGFQPN